MKGQFFFLPRLFSSSSSSSSSLLMSLPSLPAHAGHFLALIPCIHLSNDICIHLSSFFCQTYAECVCVCECEREKARANPGLFKCTKCDFTLIPSHVIQPQCGERKKRARKREREREREKESERQIRISDRPSFTRVQSPLDHLYLQEDTGTIGPCLTQVKVHLI